VLSEGLGRTAKDGEWLATVDDDFELLPTRPKEQALGGAGPAVDTKEAEPAPLGKEALQQCRANALAATLWQNEPRRSPGREVLVTWDGLRLECAHTNGHSPVKGQKTDG